jgi:hypothetical protein
MPERTAGVYKVTLEQDYLSQRIVNTWFYEHVALDDDAQLFCLNAFEEDILPSLADCQSVNLTYFSLRCANVTGTLADVARLPDPSGGTRTLTDINSFTAAGIRLNRTTKETRNGYKRIAGMGEEDTTGNTWTTAYTILLLALAGYMDDIITIGTQSFYPVIAKQKPLFPEIWITNRIDSCTVNPFITSQVSRKRGVGY